MDSASEGKKRPTILTFLCTLSLIAGSWGLMSNLSNYENANQVSTMTGQAIAETQDKILATMKGGGQQRQIMINTFKEFTILTDTVRIKQNALFGMMSNVLTLIGVFLMYRMRKKGYGVYLLGLGVYVVSPLLVFGFKNLAGISFFLLSLFVGLLFSFFYSRMLKYMD